MTALGPSATRVRAPTESDYWRTGDKICSLWFFGPCPIAFISRDRF